MKTVLPILLCYVLMTTQAYAISGGPVFGGGGVDPTGVYSGVINVTSELDYDSPVVDPVTGTLIPSTVTGFSAIGLFDLNVPSVDVATGAFLLFVDGVVYTGTITASINPDSDLLSGILAGQFDFTIITTSDTGTTVTTTSTPVSALANGKISAKIRGTRQGSLSSALISGSSTIDVDSSGIIDGAFHTDTSLECTVSGFRQSLTATAASLTSG